MREKLLTCMTIICLLLTLSACNEEDIPASVNISPSLDEAGLTSNAAGMIVKNVELPEGLAMATTAVIAGEELYIGGMDKDSLPLLMRLSPEGAVTEIALPRDVMFVHTLCQSGEMTVVLAGGYPDTYRVPSGQITFNDGDDHTLRLLRYDENDTLLSDTLLSGEGTDEGTRFDFLNFYDGCYYAMSYDSLLKFDESGESIGLISVDARETQFISQCVYHDQLLLCSSSDTGGEICVVSSSFELKPLFTTEAMTFVGMGLTGDERLMINYTESGVSAVGLLDVYSGNVERLFVWDELGVVSQSYNNLYYFRDELYAFRKFQTSAVKIIENQDAAERICLTLATDAARSELYTLVNAFNAQNESYRISVTVYDGEEMTINDLLVEMTVGKTPDIFAFFDRSGIASIRESTAFEDLLPLLDSDPTFGRDDLVPSLLDVMCNDGKLYWLPYGFGVATFIAPSYLIDHSGVSMSELTDIASQTSLPIFPSLMTRETLWGWVSQLAMSGFIDEGNGTCSFDCEEYVQLIEECERAAIKLDSNLSYGPSSVLHYELMQNLVRLSVISEQFNHSYTFTGAPTDRGNGSMFVLDLCCAISAQSDNKEESWKFVRSLLEEDNQTALYRNFPVMADILQDKLADGVENGVDYYGTIYELTETDSQRLMELINTTETIQGEHPELLAIMAEEANAYFSGSCSAEKAAANTQSRASLFMSERYG